MVGHVPLSYSCCVSQFLEISSSTVTCMVTGKRVNQGGGYGLGEPCWYSFKRNSLALKWLSGRIAKERLLRTLWPGIKKEKPPQQEEAARE